MARTAEVENQQEGASGCPRSYIAYIIQSQIGDGRRKRRFSDSITAILTPADGTTAIKVESLA